MPDIRAALTRKIGPLPAWAWGGVVGGGLLAMRALTGGGSGESSPFVQPIAGGEPFDFDAGAGAGGASGGSGSIPGTAPDAPPDWWSKPPAWWPTPTPATPKPTKPKAGKPNIDIDDRVRIPAPKIGSLPRVSTPTPKPKPKGAKVSTKPKPTPTTKRADAIKRARANVKRGSEQLIGGDWRTPAQKAKASANKAARRAADAKKRASVATAKRKVAAQKRVSTPVTATNRARAA
jgi:hypothetical protein